MWSGPSNSKCCRAAAPYLDTRGGNNCATLLLTILSSQRRLSPERDETDAMSTIDEIVDQRWIVVVVEVDFD